MNLKQVFKDLSFPYHLLTCQEMRSINTLESLRLDRLVALEVAKYQ